MSETHLNQNASHFILEPLVSTQFLSVGQYSGKIIIAVQEVQGQEPQAEPPENPFLQYSEMRSLTLASLYQATFTNLEY